MISRQQISVRYFPSETEQLIRQYWADSFPAIERAIEWLSKLENGRDVPRSVITRLRNDFMTRPSERARIRDIKDIYGRLLLELSSATYRCENNPDRCPGGVAGRSVPGSHTAWICTNNLRIGRVPDRVRIIIHETAHALDSRMNVDSYVQRGYPGLTHDNALRNADSYGSFATLIPIIPIR